MNVYFISGMGADSRVFHYLDLPEGFNKVCLEWIDHRSRETLKDYSLRLAEQIDTSEPFVLVGLSMGGMMAIEIAKHHKPSLTILISSAQTKHQLSGFYSFVRVTNLYKLIPVTVLKSLSVLKRRFTKEDQATKTILTNVIRSSKNDFLKWAIPAVLKWDNSEKVEALVHIHGTRDEILKPPRSGVTHWIKGGTHMMVMVNAKEINEIIVNELYRL